MNEFGRKLWERSVRDGITTEKAYYKALRHDRNREIDEEKKRRRSR
jgi:hypothetical protein